jgi:hypothetical protein
MYLNNMTSSFWSINHVDSMEINKILQIVVNVILLHEYKMSPIYYLFSKNKLVIWWK